MRKEDFDGGFAGRDRPSEHVHEPSRVVGRQTLVDADAAGRAAATNVPGKRTLADAHADSGPDPVVEAEFHCAKARELAAKLSTNPDVSKQPVLRADLRYHINAAQHSAGQAGAHPRGPETIASVFQLLAECQQWLGGRHADELASSSRVSARGAAPGSDGGKAVLEKLAPRFGGHSFSDVTLHTGKAGDDQAKAHGAPAVAEGKSIYLASSVDPSSAHGMRVLAHEMAHVIQQTGAAQPSATHRPHVSDAQSLEREAHQIGDIVAAGGRATPTLRTGGVVAQGFGSPEHQSMGNDVHSVLNPVAAGTEDPVKQQSTGAELGGVSPKEAGEQISHEATSDGASHAPGIGHGAVADRDRDGRVPVPQLAAMLARDPFVNERQRSLTISLRNFKMERDAAGPYLAIETDPKTKQVARYDVPVSPGDMTALNGDLYGSVENMRKAPVKEVISLQSLLDQEAKWEADVAAGKASSKDEPDFDTKYNDATSWRGQTVYGAGRDFGPEGQVTGGDEKSYYGLALTNQAHFGQETKGKRELEINVHAGKLDDLAKGPQGNSANGNEHAYMDGHARALLLAREAFVLKSSSGVSMTEQIHAMMDPYGHEANVPETGLIDPAAGSKMLPAVPKGADGKPLQRSSGAISYDSKLNDAYVENAGADHYLTDSFAAGHQIVRDVIGKVLDNFVKEKGGRDAFLSFVVARIQEGALADKEKAKGDLGTFQDKSHGWTDKAARGESWLNSHKNPLVWVGLSGDGLKQKLDAKLDDVTARSIGAKVVHDYYNRNGMIVHNAKGMTFLIKGDGHASEAPEARQIIAMAVLESRNQITEAATTGTLGDPMKVWDYTPNIDKTQFTETSGAKIMNKMMSDGPYLWALIKAHFSAGDGPSGDGGQSESASDPTQKAIAGDAPDGEGQGSYAPRTAADMGQAPARTWFEQRRAFVREQVGKTQPRPEHGANEETVDGVTLPPKGG